MGKLKSKLPEQIEDLTEAYIAESEFVRIDAGERPKAKKQPKIVAIHNDKDELDVVSGGDEADPTSSIFPQDKKRKRPWRQAIRHKAKKERLSAAALELADTVKDTSAEVEPANSAASSKREKYKARKRMKKLLKLKETQQESGDNINTNDPKSRLEASYFRYLNEQLYKLPSNEAIKLFQEDPTAFEAYHKGYAMQTKKWPVQPVETIILDLSSLPEGSIIADIGCGDAKIAAELKDTFKVHSFDLVALNDRVTVADMANLPLENDSVDAAVFCLSLMGTNVQQFIREAHRVLKTGGKLKIAEVVSRFLSVNQFISALEKMGFKLTRKKELGKNYFVHMTFQKTGEIRNKRPLGLKLRPCLYKKRGAKND